MSVSRLAHFIATINATPEKLAELATVEFAADLMHLVNANNEQPLSEAVATLPMGKSKVKGKQNQVIGDAIGQAIKATRDALPGNAGWIGAVNGSFSKASKDARTPYLIAHAAGVECFAAVLAESGEFVSAPKKTDEEKAKAKAEKDAAKAKALEDIISAKVEAGELVRASDVVTLTHEDMAQALIRAARDGDMTPDIVALLEEAVATHRALWESPTVVEEDVKRIFA